MQRNVKILATLGPSSDSKDIILRLVGAGANVFRLNMSHGTQDDKRKIHDYIREIEDELGKTICILADLQGPKIRCGVFDGGTPVNLRNGAQFRFDLDTAPGDVHRVCLPHPEIFEALKPGATILVNDGAIRLKTTLVGSNYAECEVIVGGKISDRKGVNIPDVVVPMSSLTKKDLDDLEFACAMGIDWLALSFVQRAQDVKEARKLVGNRAKIISKIEKPSAVDDFDEILAASDGIMVARGDLGVELPVQNVPPVQKRLIRACRKAGKPVVVATQMMESMITSPVPTRAEVSDVATAIYEGADAIMLSAESAAGDFPVEAVKMMSAIALEVEADPTYREITDASRTDARRTVSDSITAAAREIAETADVKAICCFTQSGTTAIRAARERPRVPILALTPNLDTARHLTLVWGLQCSVIPPVDRFKGAVQAAVRSSREFGLASGNEHIVVTAGIPFNTAGSTNIIRVAAMDESDLN